MDAIYKILVFIICINIFLYTIVLIKKFLYKKKLLASGIYEIDQMKGTTFEDYLESLFHAKGYKVRQTPKTGDYGADLIVIIENKKVAVQAKRYKNKVGIKAVQEISSAKNYYKADEVWVITNNYFTQAAMNLAKANDVILIDRDKLVNWILEDKNKAN